MKTFTLALCAYTTLLLTGCSDRLYSHRDEFAPKKASGVWNSEYEKLKKGKNSEQTKKPETARTSANQLPKI